MGWTADKMPDLAGQTLIVTGANVGLGKVTALELARRHAKVIIAVRTPERGQLAVDEIKTAVPNADVVVKKLDLMSLDSVEQFVENVEKEEKVDGIVLNAGIMALPSLQKSVDGIESQFATNVVGHTLLLVRLLPSLIKNADEKGKKARVVWVSSDLHNKADPKVGVNFETVNDEKAYSAWVWYGQTKLSNLLLSNYLSSALTPKYSNLLVSACHPGFVATELTRNVRGMSWLGSFGRWMIKSVAGKAEDGARPQLYLASTTTNTGEYWGPNKSTWEAEKQATSKFGEDKGLQKRCWEWTIGVLKEKGHSVEKELAELGISA